MGTYGSAEVSRFEYIQAVMVTDDYLLPDLDVDPDDFAEINDSRARTCYGVDTQL